MAASKTSQVSKKVFKRVETSPIRPTQLLTELTRNYSYADVQDALSGLIEERRIALTRDRHLIISDKNKLSK